MRLEYSSDGGFIVHDNSKSSLVVEVTSKQHLHKSLMQFKEMLLSNLNEFPRGYGILSFQGRLLVPNVNGLRDKIRNTWVPLLNSSIFDKYVS